MLVYGLSLASSPTNEDNIEYDVIGTNSAAFTVGDPITIASNLALVAGNSDSIIGFAVKTQTMTSTNNGTANVAPGYHPIQTNDLYLMGSNTDLTSTAANFGAYCALTANTTGTVQVNSANLAQTGANRVVTIVAVDPFNEGGTGSGSGLRTLLVRVVKTPYSNVSITS